MKSLDVAWWPIGRVHPYQQNARKISPAAIDKVAASIREYGWRQPLVVDADGVLIVGHVRWMAAKKLGLAEVPVHVASDLTPAQVKAYRLMDNRSHDEASWDLEAAEAEFAALREMDFDLDLTGFDAGELAPASSAARLIVAAVEKGTRSASLTLTEPQVFWLIHLLQKAKEPPHARTSYNAMRRKLQQIKWSDESGAA